MDCGMLARLRKFRKGSKLRLCLLNILVKKIHLEKFADLDKQFNLIDTDGTGFINKDELENALRSSENSLDIGEDEVKDIISEIDYEGNGVINYTEFLAAALPVEKFVSHDMILQVFSNFDTDGD